MLPTHTEMVRPVSDDEVRNNVALIRKCFSAHRIGVHDIKASTGPSVSLYRVFLEPGGSASSVMAKKDDIAFDLGDRGVRIFRMDGCIGVELPNTRRSGVPLRALLESEDFRAGDAALPLALGVDTTGAPVVIDLAKAPHLLLAGATKQGKSVTVGAIIASLLFSRRPEEVKFLLIDPKLVAFSHLGGLVKHHLAYLPGASEDGIIRHPQEAAESLEALCAEMDRRYGVLFGSKAKNIQEYCGKAGGETMPRIVTVFDEFADFLLMPGSLRPLAKRIRNAVIRLAQKGRAVGIHLVLTTQRPSTDVLSGLIRANFPTRIAFRVPGRVDSLTILDQPGAEHLTGEGDMLLQRGCETTRFQGAFISEKELESVAEFFAAQDGPGPLVLQAIKAEGGGEVTDGPLDERFTEAARMVVTTQDGSVSALQRRLGMGYTKATRIMEQMERAGIVGPVRGSAPREVIIHDLNTLEEILARLGI